MSSKYQMWLTHNGGTEKIRLPFLPDSVNIKSGSTNKSVTIQGLGEIVIKQDPSAIVISFSSFFPAAPFLGVQVEDLTPPEVLKDKIESWKNSDMPVHFLVTGTTINLFCVIESFNHYEQGGDVGTLHYSLTLKEYKEIHARQVKVDAPTQKAVVPVPTPTRTDNRVQAKTYTVVKGETSLWTVARKVLGDETRYSEIERLNKDLLKNSVQLEEGMVLRMP